MIGKRDKFNDHEVNQTEQTAHDKYANELNKSSVSTPLYVYQLDLSQSTRSTRSTRSRVGLRTKVYRHNRKFDT